MTKQHRAKLDKRNAARREKRRVAHMRDAATDAIKSINKDDSIRLWPTPTETYWAANSKILKECADKVVYEDTLPPTEDELRKFFRWGPEEIKQTEDSRNAVAWMKYYHDVLHEPNDEQVSIHKSVEINPLLSEANTIVTDRHAKYGHPKEDFTRIAGMWSSYLGHPITASDVACMMIQLKLSRSKASYGRDNMVDVVGYAICHEDLQEPEIPF